MLCADNDVVGVCVYVRVRVCTRVCVVYAQVLCVRCAVCRLWVSAWYVRAVEVPQECV